ncbi:MAG: hypothetical protein NTY77_03075 [Elusimicrobia bacterium]|nr:hypothetical protein [Elusimicrobiota bacterium]
MKRLRTTSPLLWALLACALWAGPARGAITLHPSTILPGSIPVGINYQGRIQVDGKDVTSDSRAPWGIVFRIYNCNRILPTVPCVDEQGKPEQLLAVIPSSYTNTSIDISAGLFKAGIIFSTSDLFDVGGQRWLEVEIDKPFQKLGDGQKLTPRGLLTAMPYALVAKSVEGTIDISEGDLSITTAAATNNTAFYISSGTAFIGVWTSHPYTLLTISSGTLTLDGPGAGLHLASGTMTIDGAGASLVVVGPATFGNPGTQSTFTVTGTLQLPSASPLGPPSGGTGNTFSSPSPVKGDIPYFSVAGSKMDLLNIDITPDKILRSGSTKIPGWTSATYPSGSPLNSVPKNSLLYGDSASNQKVSALGIGAASTTLRSNGTAPAWGSVLYPNSVAQGDLLYGYYNTTLSSVSLLAIGPAGKILRSTGAVPSWSSVNYSTEVYEGDLLYGSAINIVSTLTLVTAATSYLANTGGGNTIPAWEKVDLTNGVKNALSIAHGGTGSDLYAAGQQGAIPYFSNATQMAALAPDTSGYVLETNGDAPPSWVDLSAAGVAYAAHNLAGGAQGSLPYQLSGGNTGMLAKGTAGQLLMMAVTSPTWTTATYPGSTSKNQILYSSFDNTVAGLVAKSSGVLVTDGSGAPAIGKNIPTGVTIGGSYIYRVGGGTKVRLEDGGTNADLSGAGNIGGLLFKFDASTLAVTGPLTGILRADGAGPTAMTGTLGYDAYWLTTSTIAAEQYTAVSRGGTNADLSGAGRIGGLLYKVAGGPVPDQSRLAVSEALTGVLRADGNGPTANTGTTGYNAYWLTASTIAAEQYTAVSRGGTNADLSLSGAGRTGGLLYLYKVGPSTTIVVSEALTGVLRADGNGPTANTGTANYITYWLTASTIAATLRVALSSGGTGTDLSGATTGGLIYKKDATSLAGTGALPDGVLRGDGTGTPAAMTGTPGYIAYWVTDSTIAATRYVSISSGGTNADNSAADTGALFYMAGSSIVATSALTGVLKSNGNGAPSAMTGTANYLAYWSDNYTLAATRYVSISSGGTNADTY